MIPTILISLLFATVVLWSVDIALTWFSIHFPKRPPTPKPTMEELQAFHHEVRKMNGDE